MPGPAQPFEKGKSGNPGGRPKMTPEMKQAQENARAASPEMVDILIGIARASDDDKARIAAANAVLDRALGKPTQRIANEDDEPLKVEVTGDDARAELARALAGLASRLAPG